MKWLHLLLCDSLTQGYQVTKQKSKLQVFPSVLRLEDKAPYNLQNRFRDSLNEVLQMQTFPIAGKLKDVKSFKQIMPYLEDRPKDTSEDKWWVIFCKDYASGHTD